MIPEKTRTTWRMLRFGVTMLQRGLHSRKTVADLIESQAAARPDQCFVRFEGREVTYRDYNEGANRVAHWAMRSGIASGDVVALLMHNRPEFLMLWAGLAKVGATTAMLNTNLTGRSLAHVLATSQTKRVVIGSECLDNFATVDPEEREGLEAYIFSEPGEQRDQVLPDGARSLDDELAKQPPSNPPREVRESVRAGDPLFFIYTSGTTGLPKAARFSHSRFFGACVHSYLQGFGPGDTMYCALPLYHTAGGVMTVSAVLTGGGTLALRRRFSASEFFTDVTRMKATAFVYIGEICRYLLNQPPSEVDRAHAIRFAVGNGMRPDVWPRFQERFAIPHIIEFYGATEANVTMMNLDNKVGSVGKLPPGMKRDARIIRYDIDRDEHPRDARGYCIVCEPGEVGELIGKISHGRTAKGRFEGYTSSEASEKKILHEVFKSGDSWFRSGDLLRVDTEGYFYFVDRIGDTFRWKGENVSTEEVGEAVGRFDGVRIATIYSVELPGREGRAGMAAIALVEGVSFDGAGLYSHVLSSLPDYAVPVFVRVRDNLETTGTFKVRKVDLQREGFDPTSVTDPLYVRDDTSKSYVLLSPALQQSIIQGNAPFR